MTSPLAPAAGRGSLLSAPKDMEPHRLRGALSIPGPAPQDQSRAFMGPSSGSLRHVYQGWGPAELGTGRLGRKVSARWLGQGDPKADSGGGWNASGRRQSTVGGRLRPLPQLGQGLWAGGSPSPGSEGVSGEKGFRVPLSR